MPWIPEPWRPAAAFAILLVVLGASVSTRRTSLLWWLVLAVVAPFGLAAAVVIQTGDPAMIRLGLLFAPFGLLFAALEALTTWLRDRRQRIETKRSGDYALVPARGRFDADPQLGYRSGWERWRKILLLALHAAALLVGFIAPRLGAPQWVTFAIFYVVFGLWVLVGASSIGAKTPRARSVVERTANGRS